MIVYRDHRASADPRQLVSQLRSEARRARTGTPSHELVRDLLIEAGILESALADAVFPHTDGLHPVTDLCRSASLAIAHAFWHSWHGRAQNTGRCWEKFVDSLDALEARQLPREVKITDPEGYSQYSVYPEMYLEAAKRCHSVLGVIPVVCIGIRSIGSSLSAVVSASLRELGCAVESFTVRPRGHPYDRSLQLDPLLTERIMGQSSAMFLIVDEGPGISGSSFGGTVRLLGDLGVHDQQICLFPSWRTDGAHLRSTEARRGWSRYRQFTASFEEVWLDTGRLASVFPGELLDVSAGAWRSLVYSEPGEYPAVQPQHERRKYLLTSRSGDGNPRLLRFAGLGPRSKEKVRRAVALGRGGFTPAAEGSAHGFLLQTFVAGRPVVAQEADATLINRVASYLAHIAGQAGEPSVDDSSLREMILVNVAEGLKSSRLEQVVRHLPSQSWVERPVQLDARMLAHEWIRTPDGYVKVDAVDHHADHFFPGCQDIAWDVAAAAVELRLDPPAEHHLVEAYRALSGDGNIRARLPLYSIAYLAFRLGYTQLAASTLGDNADAGRFLVESRRYAGLLSRDLEAWSLAGSHA